MNKKNKWWMYIFPIVFFFLSVLIIVEGSMSGNKSSAQSKHFAVIFDSGPKNANIINPESLKMEKEEYSLLIGDSINLNPVFTPSDTTDKRVKYNILDNSDCVSISNDKLIGIKEGKADIEVISEANSSLKFQFVVDVKKEKINELKGTFKKNDLIKGMTTKFEVTSNKEDMTLDEITFVSTNTDVATIDTFGIIRTENIGTTDIYAYSKEDKSIKTDRITLNVIDGKFFPTTSINYDSEISIYVGEEKQIVPTFNKDCSDTLFSIVSDYENIYSKDDCIYSKKEGTYEVSLVSINNPGVKTAFTVNVLEVKPTSISVSFSSIQYGKTEKLSYSLVSEKEGLNVTYPDVKFVSSDTSIANIDSNGYLVGLKKGSVNITVLWKKDESISGTATIAITAMDATKFDNINHIVRKLIGHFGSFLVTAVFGVLSIYFFFVKNKSIYISLSVLLVYGLLLAMLSEFLQIFAGNRGPSWNDVGIDYGGYALGFICTMLIAILIKQIRNRRKKTENID